MMKRKSGKYFTHFDGRNLEGTSGILVWQNIPVINPPAEFLFAVDGDYRKSRG
jgi:hypothetical protein